MMEDVAIGCTECWMASEVDGDRSPREHTGGEGGVSERATAARVEWEAELSRRALASGIGRSFAGLRAGLVKVQAPAVALLLEAAAPPIGALRAVLVGPEGDEQQQVGGPACPCQQFNSP